jgi:hypothetical protein
MKPTFLLAAFIAAFLSLAAAAQAASLVFIRDGNVWVSAADGSSGHAVTGGGGWAAPSEADDGTILAKQGHDFVHLTQAGAVLSRIDASVGDGSGPASGPLEPVVSPDGKRIAYWYYQQVRYLDTNCNCYLVETKAHVSTTPVDHFEAPTPGSELDVYRAPSWIGNDRLLVSDYAWVSTYVPGWDNYGEQRWYNDYMRAWAIDHQELSADGTKLAIAHGDTGSPPLRLALYRVSAPPFAGAPPYDDYATGAPHPDVPEPACVVDFHEPITGPSWSPDSQRLAYARADGIHVSTVPDGIDCSQISDALVLPGASQPRFGKSDLEPWTQGSPPPPPVDDPPPPPPVTSPPPTKKHHRKYKKVCKVKRRHHKRVRVCHRVLVRHRAAAWREVAA